MIYIYGPLLCTIPSLVPGYLFLVMVTDDLIRVNFSKDELSYQIIRDRITIHPRASLCYSALRVKKYINYRTIFNSKFIFSFKSIISQSFLFISSPRTKIKLASSDSGYGIQCQTPGLKFMPLVPSR